MTRTARVSPKMIWLIGALFSSTACNDDNGGLADAGDVAREAAAADALPAVAAISMSPDRVSYGASGSRRRGDPRELQISIFDRFAIGSMTKAMTATLAGILVQDHLIEWDSKLYEVLPELAANGRPEYAEVTLRDLLVHAGGLYPILTAEEFAAVPPLTGSLIEQRIELVQWVVSIAPSISPGVELEYSNSGYVAAAAMMERATRQQFEQLIESRLFKPLGIQPRFESPAARSDLDQPWPHLRDGTTQTWIALDPRSDELLFPAVANPAGGISLRLTELAAFMKLHLQALRGRTGLVISPQTAEVLHTQVLASQSIGWVQTFDDKMRPIAFTAGSDEYSFYAMMAIAADRERAAAVVTNGYDAGTEDRLAVALTKLLD